MAGPSWAKVLERTIGVITAPWIGSGSCPAWMHSVSMAHSRAEFAVSLMAERLARARSGARALRRVEGEAGEERLGDGAIEAVPRESPPGMRRVERPCTGFGQHHS